MPVKIRLQRHGKKGKPYYWIVAADARSKRDGKYLEKLGSYNPNVNPAIIDLNIDGAVKWLENGAQPTDTARAILSYKGAMLKKHLAGGIKKGALTEEEAEKKFNAWLEEKAAKIQAKADNLDKSKAEAKAKALEAEKAVNEARLAPPPVVEEATEAAEATTEEAPEDVAETAEASVEAATEEVAEAAEEVKEEATEEIAEASEETAEATEAATEEVAEATEEVKEEAEEIAEASEVATEEVAEASEETAEEATETVEASKEEEE
ncbi:MAG: 30S ribosomal protein S16 [Bacteroidia bacterium]|nr:30S ribosomal protein S16 [Bacteroidia bacterium]NND51031.1 30S ribosomal protein S16 [Flavobacteriaceae bacterium]